MIGLIIDRRAALESTLALDASSSIVKRVGREGIPSIVISDNAIEKNSVAMRVEFDVTGDLAHVSASTLIRQLALAWSLQEAQILYVAATAAAITDATSTDATLVRIGDTDDVDADQSIANVSELLDIVASEYTASLLEMRYILMPIAYTVEP